MHYGFFFEMCDNTNAKIKIHKIQPSPQSTLAIRTEMEKKNAI